MQQIRSSFPPTLPELVPVLNEACKEQQKITAKQQGAMERQQRTIAELSDRWETNEAGAPERSGCRRHGGVRTRS